MKKTPSHFMSCVEIEWQISFFPFGFAHVTEVRHVVISVKIRIGKDVEMTYSPE